MSKLEELIIRCRKVWVEMGLSSEEIDDMIDSFVPDTDYNFSEETIKLKTEEWFRIVEEEEKNENR